MRRGQEESARVRNVEKMYLSTLGRHRPGNEGIPSDWFDSAESDADVGRDFSISDTYQESKCSNEKRCESMVVRKSMKKRREDDLPVVRIRESDTEVTGSGSND